MLLTFCYDIIFPILKYELYKRKYKHRKKKKNCINFIWFRGINLSYLAFHFNKICFFLMASAKQTSSMFKLK